MKIILILSLFTLFAGCAKKRHSAHGEKLLETKLIIGTDDRAEVKGHSSKFLKKMASSVAIQIENKYFQNNILNLENAPTLSQRSNLCKDESFANQPAIGECTAFLIGPDLMMTAGHCFDIDYTKTIAENCKSYKWVFDYEKGKTTKKENTYSCKEVEHILADYEEERDYAIFRLDRKVENKPFFKVTLNKIEKGTKLAMIGSPLGAYKKITAGGKFLGMKNHLLMADLDTFGGNSGGPIINMKTKEVVAVLIQGSALSFIKDEEKNCNRYNRSCKEVTGYPCQSAVGFPTKSMRDWLFDGANFDLTSL